MPWGENRGDVGSQITAHIQCRNHVVPPWRVCHGALAEALWLCREYAVSDQTAVAEVSEGYPIGRRSKPRAGVTATRGGIADLAAIGTVVGSVIHRALLAEPCARQGDTDDALAILTEPLPQVKRMTER
jgi:hypothetical protein